MAGGLFIAENTNTGKGIRVTSGDTGSHHSMNNDDSIALSYYFYPNISELDRYEHLFSALS
jgi:hypothetical protein